MNNQSIANRDEKLDVARGIVMLYIVCWIHGMWWCGCGNDFLRSVCLFEMPVIFYIAGASARLSAPKTFVKTLINRFKRIYIPYYIYVIAWCFALACCSSLQKVTLNSIVATLLGYNFNMAPWQFHIWFILPYMFISCFFFLQRKLIEKYSFIYLFCNIILLILAQYSGSHSLVMYIVCYNFFYVLGYVSYNRWKCPNPLIGIGLIIIPLYYSGHLEYMQSHKFPPDIVFIIFGIGWIIVLCRIFPLLHIRYRTVIKRWNVNGYTIYLWQTIPFVLYYVFILPYQDILNGWWRDFLVVLFLFVFNTCLSPLFVFIENKIRYLCAKCFKFCGTK